MIDNTGIGRYLRNILTQLAHLDTQNDYVVFINAGDSQVVTQDNITFVPLKVAVPIYSWQEQIWLPLEIRRWNLDLMHYPNFNIPLIQSCPYVVTIHDLIYYLYPDQCPSKAAHHYARFMLKYATRHAQSVITVSEHSKRDLIKYLHLPAHKIRVILQASDGDLRQRTASREPTSVTRKYGITQPYVLYVGKHHGYKNITTLLQAYMTHQDVYANVQLVIAGKRDPRQQTLYDMAAALASDHRILFTDFLPDDDLAVLYREARLFVFPSCYEGFGLPPLEAMACGVPVISSNAASLPEVVGEAAIQVDPLDKTAMADAMRTVLTNSERWHDLKQKGLRRAQLFSWETTTRHLLDVYQKAQR